MCGFVLFFVNFVTYADLYKPLVQALLKKPYIVHRFRSISIKKSCRRIAEDLLIVIPISYGSVLP